MNLTNGEITMALITRITRLFRADLHAVLDHIEEPDILLRQALREMEASFTGSEQQLNLLQHEAVQLENRTQDFEQALQDMDDELDICFFSEQNDLARALVRRKLESKRHLKQTAEKLTTTRQNCSIVEQKLSEQRAQLENIRQKVELLNDDPASSGRENSWQAREFLIRDDEVEIAFLKEKQKRSHS
jgi:phage shock protein A